MRKVYYGKQPEPSDFKGKEEKVTTCWAVFSRDTDGSIGIDKWNYSKLLEVAKDVVTFKEGNLMGWTMTDGTLVVPAWFDQVELCKHFLYLHHGNHYTTVSHRCCSPDRKDEDREYYVVDGFLGLRNPKTGEHLSPADYDYIYEWREDCDVIYTVRDGVPQYYNHRWEPILTEWRKFPDVKDDDEPYFRSERQRLPYLILTEPVAKPIDNQCCWAYNRWVRLDRNRRLETSCVSTARFSLPLWMSAMNSIRPTPISTPPGAFVQGQAIQFVTASGNCPNLTATKGRGSTLRRYGCIPIHQCPWQNLGRCGECSPYNEIVSTPMT